MALPGALPGINAVKGLSGVKPFLLAMGCPTKREGRCPLG